MTPALSAAHVVLAQKGWQALAGLVTVALVTRFLSPEEQGLYYAIGSLMSSFLVLDLGLSGLLVQVSARMFAGLSFAANGQVQPAGPDKQAFLQMLAWCRRWYARAAWIALLLIPIGYGYFTAASDSASTGAWQGPWLVVVVCAALSMSALPLQAVVEGAGRVSEVYLVRLAHYVFGALMAWALLAAGWGLYAPAAAPLLVALATHVWVRSRYKSLTQEAQLTQGNFSEREALWPLQKRVALTWAASYAFLNAPTLVAFYFLDAATAGRIGLSMVVANLLGSMCASWLIAKVPRITQDTAMGAHAQSRAVFALEFKRAMGWMLVCYGMLSLLAWGIADWPIAQRFLGPLDMLVMSAAFMVFHAISMLGVYFRAQSQERLALPLAIGTALGTGLACLLAPHFGSLGVVLAFLGAFVLVALPAMSNAWRASLKE